MNSLGSDSNKQKIYILLMSNIIVGRNVQQMPNRWFYKSSDGFKYLQGVNFKNLTV